MPSPTFQNRSVAHMTDCLGVLRVLKLEKLHYSTKLLLHHPGTSVMHSNHITVLVAKNHVRENANTLYTGTPLVDSNTSHPLSHVKIISR